MKKSRMIAWTVWLIASIFYAYQYILRVMPNIMMDDIIHQFHIDAAMFGQFSGVYYIGYSLVHLPIGIMLDRYGPKKVLTGCILLTVIGLLPILLAENWAYPILGRAIIGVGSSAAILGAFKIIRLTFREQHFTRMLSLTVTIGLIGGIYGGGPLNYMCEQWGYRSVIQIFMGVGICLATITYLLLPKEKEHTPLKIRAGIKQVFTNSKVLVICFSAGLMVGPMEGFADVWASEFLKKVYHFDVNIAGYLPSMIFLGMCFGAPVLGLLAEKTGRYLGVIIGAGLVMISVFVALLLGYFTISGMTFAFILVGVCCAYQILAIYKASTYVPENLAGLTTAVANMIIMSFGYAFHTIIGVVVSAYGGIAEANAFLYGISVIPLALGAGVLGFLIVAASKQQSA
jgi:predicted MFS family arabinose efflux permease